jgi:hypothetical protein
MTTPTVLSRDDIRASIFAAKPKSKVIEFFGTQVEIRQPPLREVLAARDEGADINDAAYDTFIKYVFVPGTDQKVFDDTDIPGIKNLPFGTDMQALQSAINELTDIQAAVKTQEGNSEGA